MAAKEKNLRQKILIGTAMMKTEMELFLIDSFGLTFWHWVAVHHLLLLFLSLEKKTLFNLFSRLKKRHRGADDYVVTDIV